ncbi:MAG TPA: septum formation initiator family protein [Acidimicrobiales bacterium]|nr:septum formation initiator family protein [Acidimicrobiales bacterium]
MIGRRRSGQVSAASASRSTSTRGAASSSGRRRIRARHARALHPQSRAAARAALKRRRARVVLILAAGFSVLVLVTEMPVSALISQRHQISSSESQALEMQAANRTLSREAANLTNPASVDEIARGAYGLVSPGDKAYDVLPPSGSSPTAASLSGHVPLDGPPVVPGSRLSQQLLGAGSVSTSPNPGYNDQTAPGTGSGSGEEGGGKSGEDGNGSSGQKSSPASGDGSKQSFWGRVVNTLEFWR